MVLSVQLLSIRWKRGGGGRSYTVSCRSQGRPVAVVVGRPEQYSAMQEPRTTYDPCGRPSLRVPYTSSLGEGAVGDPWKVTGLQGSKQEQAIIPPRAAGSRQALSWGSRRVEGPSRTFLDKVDWLSHFRMQLPRQPHQDKCYYYISVQIITSLYKWGGKPYPSPPPPLLPKLSFTVS